MQRNCFEQDFQRLGPSIIRFLESRLLGYQQLKNSANPALLGKAAHYARELRNAYPVFLAGRLFGPNAKVRRWIGEVERNIHAELGRPTVAERVKSVVVVGAAVWTAFTIKFDLFQHPSLRRTAYRLPSKSWKAFQLWEEIPQKFALPDFSIQVDLQHAKKQVWLRLEGALSSKQAEGLAQRIQDSLARSKSRLVLDLNRLQWDKVDNLQPLRDKLAGYRDRVQLILPKLSSAHPEIILLAAMFQHYKG
jgi:hypothetical protein